VGSKGCVQAKLSLMLDAPLRRYTVHSTDMKQLGGTVVKNKKPGST